MRATVAERGQRDPDTSGTHPLITGHAIEEEVTELPAGQSAAMRSRLTPGGWESLKILKKFWQTAQPKTAISAAGS